MLKYVLKSSVFECCLLIKMNIQLVTFSRPSCRDGDVGQSLHHFGLDLNILKLLDGLP